MLSFQGSNKARDPHHVTKGTERNFSLTLSLSVKGYYG